MTYSLKKGALHAVLFVVAFVITFGVAALAWGQDPEAAGQLAGYGAFPAFGLGLLISWFIQQGHRAVGLTLAVILCALGPAGLYFGTRSGAAAPTTTRTDADTITEADKSGLVVAADSVRHRDLGFAFPNPGPDFAIVDPLPPPMLQQMQSGPMVFWLLRNADESEAVVVQLIRGLSSEADMQSFARGLLRGAERAGATVEENTVQWKGPLREARFAIQTTDGLHARWRCLAPSSGRSRNVLVCLNTVTGDQTNLNAVRNGFTFAGR